MLAMMYVGGVMVVGFGAWVIKKGLTAKEPTDLQWELKRGYIQTTLIWHIAQNLTKIFVQYADLTKSNGYCIIESDKEERTMMNNTYMNLAITDEANRDFLDRYVMQYQEELSDNNREYHISIDDFKNYLTKKELWGTFQTALKDILKRWVTLEYVAIDYEIPVAMVKYFLKTI